jgi:hypothetical protein
MSHEVVYRVMFSGDWVPIDVARELRSSDVWLEGSRSGVGPSHHWALVHAHSRDEAARLVRDAVAPHGGFSDFAAEPVRDSKGDLWCGSFHRRWDEIDWGVVGQHATLSDVHRQAMYALADAAEPTELVRREVGLPPPTVEKALRELCEKGLAEHFVLPFFDGDYDKEDEDWWRLTHEAWDLLGFIKPVRYH